MKEYPEVDNGIARIKLVYEWATGYCISFIIADDKEVQEYIKASSAEGGLCTGYFIDYRNRNFTQIRKRFVL